MTKAITPNNPVELMSMVLLAPLVPEEVEVDGVDAARLVAELRIEVDDEILDGAIVEVDDIVDDILVELTTAILDPLILEPEPLILEPELVAFKAFEIEVALTLAEVVIGVAAPTFKFAVPPPILALVVHIEVAPAGCGAGVVGSPCENVDPE